MTRTRCQDYTKEVVLGAWLDSVRATTARLALVSEGLALHECNISSPPTTGRDTGEAVLGLDSC